MDLTDAQWERIAPLMPVPRDNCKLPTRQALNGWLFITRQGCAWRALPERYGPWFTVYMRGKRWAERGLLARVFAELQQLDLEAEPPAERAHLDSTIVKVHQDGSGAPRRRGGRRSAAHAGA
jgi:transposase